MHHLAYLAVYGPGKKSINPAFTAVMVLTAIPFRTGLGTLYNELTATQWMEKERFDGQTQALLYVHKVGDERRNHLMHGLFSGQRNTRAAGCTRLKQTSDQQKEKRHKRGI